MSIRLELDENTAEATYSALVGLILKIEKLKLSAKPGAETRYRLRHAREALASLVAEVENLKLQNKLLEIEIAERTAKAGEALVEANRRIESAARATAAGSPGDAKALLASASEWRELAERARAEDLGLTGTASDA